jgi:hypothetical protein
VKIAALEIAQKLPPKFYTPSSSIVKIVTGGHVSGKTHTLATKRLTWCTSRSHLAKYMPTKPTQRPLRLYAELFQMHPIAKATAELLSEGVDGAV